MKKYLVFLFLILVSCQPDEIFVDSELPNYDMVFQSTISKIVDGQDISFEVITNTQHQLIITQQDGSVITKETFTPTIGVNTHTIYTNSLPIGQYYLILKSDTEELEKTTIIID